MTITSFWFLVLISVGAGVYYLLPKSWQWVQLLLLSLVFYYFAAEPWTVLYLAGATLTVYAAALAIDKLRAKEKQQLCLGVVVLAVTVNLAVWFVVKGKGLWGFFAASLYNHVGLKAAQSLLGLQLLAALGMGYYTLQLLGYLIDCYWENIPPQKNPLKLFLFAVYFPQLTTGPISRYAQLAAAMFVLWMVMGIWHGGLRYIVGVSLWYWIVLMLGELLSPWFVRLTTALRMKTDSFGWHLFQSARTYLIYAIGASFFSLGMSRSLALLKDAWSVFWVEGCANPWIFFDQSVLQLGVTYGDLNLILLAVLFLVVVACLREKYTYARIWVERQSFLFRWMIWIGLFLLVLIYGKYGPGYSAAFVYWQPLKAWNDCGFTSYSYATNSIQAEQIKAYIQEALKTQSPRLFVIDARAFQYYSDQPSEAGLRNGSDSMNLWSPARFQLLNEYFDHRTITEETDILSYYLDIAKYHTNTENLASSAAWNLRNNEGVSSNKGWEWVDAYNYLEEPVDFQTEKRAELLAHDEEILTDLLSFARRKKVELLFVVCPYWITKEDQEKYNTIGDLVESSGFRFLNTNEFYQEMGIDFATDFYNKNHVNLFGAAKYTEFLQNYLLQYYDLPDHRSDAAYASWQEDYERFRQEEEVHAQTVQGLWSDTAYGKEIAGQMQQAQTLSEWENLAADPRFTLLIAASGQIEWPQSIADQQILSAWGFAQEHTTGIRVIKNRELLYTNDADQALVWEGKLGVWEDTPAHISLEQEPGVIEVNGTVQTAGEPGILVLVFDNNLRQAADAAVLRCDETGAMRFYREKPSVTVKVSELLQPSNIKK